MRDLMPTAPTPPLYRYVGRIIHVMRKERGLRQSELAALTGLKQPNLSRIENGLVVPRQSTLRKVAEALDVELKELLSEAKAQEVEKKWSAALSPKNAGQVFAGKLLPVVLYSTNSGYGVTLDKSGVVNGTEELTLQLPPVPGRVFATRAYDDSMENHSTKASSVSIRKGEIIVFSDQPPVKSGDLAFIQLRDKALFRQVSLVSGDGRIRLLPLNRKHKERIVRRSEIRALCKLVRRIQEF